MDNDMAVKTHTKNIIGHWCVCNSKNISVKYKLIKMTKIAKNKTNKSNCSVNITGYMSLISMNRIHFY